MGPGFRLFAALILIVANIAGTAQCEDNASKHLKVGAILGLTGGAARHADGIRKGQNLLPLTCVRKVGT